MKMWGVATAPNLMRGIAWVVAVAQVIGHSMPAPWPEAHLGSESVTSVIDSVEPTVLGLFGLIATSVTPLRR